MKCPECGEEMRMEKDLLDLMPDEFYICDDCALVGYGWINEI